jgi:HD-like signal output (HDOD) protein
VVIKREVRNVIVLIVGRDTQTGFEISSALHELGVDWRIEVAADATSALLFAQKNHIDIVVSEMRPIGMEGTALLDAIRKHHPDVMRIMLLDECEESQMMKAFAAAHRLLNKPLRAEELLEAGESIAELKELLSSKELQAAVGKIDKLPPPPKLYFALTKALEDPNVSAVTLGSLIQQDPVMSAKVLRLCNSAYFFGGRTIADIRSAVISLGQQVLRRLVLATEVFVDSANSRINRDVMRQRAFQGSMLAAKLLGGSSAELAATAALLAEVGMLLPGVQIINAKGELVGSGPHYAEAGAYLLGVWGLPMPIVEAVAHHHQPSKSKARGLWVGGAVHVAHALVSDQPVDEDYLSAIGMSEKLPGWRKLAQEVMQQA